MANCHDLFCNFHKEIHLSSEKKEQLRTSRNALRKKIRKYFKEELKVNQPKFFGQGSYMMNTIVNPLDGEFDLDDGIYLEHLKDVEKDDRPTTSTVHQWVVNATTGHTTTKPVNKNTCVRVIYKNHYHIDLPIYIKEENKSPELAHLTEGWIQSDPKAFTNWFKEQVKEHGDQMRKIVQYLKAWKDFKENDVKFPSGMILTVLAAKFYVSDYPEDDDAALVATAKEIQTALSENFSVKRPIEPGEELFEGWSESRKTNFLNKLNTFVKLGQEALEEESTEKASEKWIKVFGDRFPKYEGNDTETMALKTTSPAILGNHGRSA